VFVINQLSITFFYWRCGPPVGHGPFINDVDRSHMTHHSR